MNQLENIVTSFFPVATLKSDKSPKKTRSLFNFI